MSLVRWNPARELNRMQEELNRLFSGLVPGDALETSFARGAWEPAVDISETPESYMVTAELPGLTKDDVSINYEDGILTIRGEKKQEKEEKRKNYHRVERSFGASITHDPRRSHELELMGVCHMQERERFELRSIQRAHRFDRPLGEFRPIDCAEDFHGFLSP